MDWPIPHRRQGVGSASQSRKGANSAPERASPTKLRTGFQFLTKDFLRFWTVDIYQEGRSQRSAPEKTHMAHLRQCTQETKWLGRGGDKMHHTKGECAHQASGHLSCSDLGRAQNAGPTKSAPLWSTQEPEPEQLRPGKCMQPSAHFRQFPCRATWSLSSMDGKTHTP